MTVLPGLVSAAVREVALVCDGGRQEFTERKSASMELWDALYNCGYRLVRLCRDRHGDIILGKHQMADSFGDEPSEIAASSARSHVSVCVCAPPQSPVFALYCFPRGRILGPKVPLMTRQSISLSPLTCRDRGVSITETGAFVLQLTRRNVSQVFGCIPH